MLKVLSRSFVDVVAVVVVDVVDIEVDPDFDVEGVRSVVLIVDVAGIKVDPDFDVEGVSSLFLIVVVTNVCSNGFVTFTIPQLDFSLSKFL